MKNILILIIFTFSLNAKADLASSLSLRSHIEQTHPSLVQASNSIKLRTTRGIDQKDSLFCWAFATANLLETSFLEKNPNINPKDIELSRWYIEKAVPSIYQLGTAIDALYTYSPQIGYVRNSEYKRGTHRTLNYTKFLNEKLSPKELRLKLIGDKEYWSYFISISSKVRSNNHRRLLYSMFFC